MPTDAMDSTLKDNILDLIARESDMTIATVCPDGQPLASTVSYASSDLILYFGTSSNSGKVENIKHENRVSLTINRPYRFWKDIEGLTVTGIASIVQAPEEFRKASQLVFEKFPLVNDFARHDSDEVVFIKITPVKIHYLNYRKGVGHTEQITIDL